LVSQHRGTRREKYACSWAGEQVHTYVAVKVMKCLVVGFL
jgi:hypothetical protein